MSQLFEILRNVGIGLLAGVIYVWPFAASHSYKRLVSNDVREGRTVALLVKFVSMIVGACAAIAAIIVVRAFSTKPLAWIDFIVFLAAAIVSGVLAWRYLFKMRRA